MLLAVTFVFVGLTLVHFDAESVVRSLAGITF